MNGELPLPPHYRPERVEEVWRVDYEALAAGAEQWAGQHGVLPAAGDETHVCLVAVDCQNTFCLPGFELFVPGAPDDTRRLCSFVYRNLAAITEIVVTLDTHQAFQIFHAAWLEDDVGRHPAPYTLVSAEDVERGVWRAASPEHRDHLLSYTRALEAGGKYRLTVWPYHAMLGGIGHALVAALEEAVFFHAIARSSPTRFEVKGSEPLTEHYSVLGPEVPAGGATRNATLIDHLREFDAVVIAGQAKSHCVAWTIDDLLRDFRDLAHRVYLLEDCTSPVIVPGVVDYTEEADAAFQRFADAGMHIVPSTDPISAWPDISLG
ncbi:MAG: isochorismatase [Gaiellaceae bacterium]